LYTAADRVRAPRYKSVKKNARVPRFFPPVVAIHHDDVRILTDVDNGFVRKIQE